MSDKKKYLLLGGLALSSLAAYYFLRSDKKN
jgi:hypothetical protein